MNTSERKLIQLFPELKGGEVIDTTMKSSYNDGGTDYTFIWKVGDEHYRTVFNDWCLGGRDTRCEKVVKQQETVTYWVPV